MKNEKIYKTEKMCQKKDAQKKTVDKPRFFICIWR